MTLNNLGMALTSWWRWIPASHCADVLHRASPVPAGTSAAIRRVHYKTRRPLYRAKPSSADEILSWAQKAFEQEAGCDPFNLPKACMLVSLEEEAAAEVSQTSYLSAEGYEPNSLARLRLGNV